VKTNEMELDCSKLKLGGSVGRYHRLCATGSTVKNTAVLGSTVTVGLLSLLPQPVGLLA